MAGDESLREPQAPSSRIPANVSEPSGHTAKGVAAPEEGAGGGTGRLNLPGEFMTELFKGCLVVLNPVTAALAFPSSPVSRFEPIVHAHVPSAHFFVLYF